MYFAAAPFRRTEPPPGWGFGQPAAAAPCPADQVIDSNTALLMSPLAPLAAHATGGCDKRAVWSYVPSQPPESLSVHVYLHGNNNLVTASAASPGGRPADWAGRNTPTPLRRGGPYAAGRKYEMDVAAQGSPQRPVVLVPEDTVRPAGRSRYWAVGDPGAFEGDASRLGAMISDCLTRLRSLAGAGTAFTQRLAEGTLRRLFLSGHSGGGQPLSRCAVSDLALNAPTDLWLYDCTYWPAHTASYIRFATTWARRRLLGNAASSSRVVILVTGDELTTSNAESIVRGIESALGVRRMRVDRGTRAAPSGTVVEAMPSATVPQIEAALRAVPVTFIHTGVGHDMIPLVWTPRLLATAAAP